MKFRTMIFLAVLAVILTFVLAGCVLVPMSIEARLNSFIQALNAADRANVSTNFSSVETQDYEAIKSGAYWDTPFPAAGAGNPDYSITTAINPSDPLSVEVTIAGPPAFGGPKDFRFVMVNDGTRIENWKIHELWIWDTGSSAYIELIK
jgi:hypothetical protein